MLGKLGAVTEQDVPFLSHYSGINMPLQFFELKNSEEREGKGNGYIPFPTFHLRSVLHVVDVWIHPLHSLLS